MRLRLLPIFQDLSYRRRRSRILAVVLFLLIAASFPGTTNAQEQLAAKGASPGTEITSPTRESPSSTEEDVQKLKIVVADQQRRIEHLEQMLLEERKLIEQALHMSATTSALATNLAPGTETPANQPPATTPIREMQDTKRDEPSPLSLQIGHVSVTPYGFLDFTAVARQRNVGSGLGTNFGSIPFSNTVNGNLSEFRFTAQNSRLGVRFDARHRGADFLGFVETDFLGFSPGNVAITTNSNGIRMRLFWADVRKGKWEILGGQSWSLLTPNRKGTSPVPADVFSSQDIDPSLQVGLTWARDPQFRVIYHANKTVTMAVSLEAAEQYGGGSAGSGDITLPAALANSYGPQLNTGGSTFGVPNLHPDVIAKIAFDPKVHNRDLHFEVAGLISGFKFFNPQDQQTHRATGGGVSFGVNFEALKNFRLISNGFYSSGGGRWIFGLAPNLIIKANGEPSLMHSASTVTGFEYQATPNNLLDAYYGGVYAFRNTAIDLNGEPVGYGYSGSPSDQNRSIQEITLGYTRTFWRDPNYGALQFITQYSYIVRHPWSVAPDQPGSARLNLVYLTLRYILPGAPPSHK